MFALAILLAIAIAAPDEIPTNKPSLVANCLVFIKASSSVTVSILSIKVKSRILGLKPAPIP